MRILITGAAGMLGQDVSRVGRAAGHEVIALSRAELDITDADAVSDRLDEERADVVVNCAAWTDVDGAEGAEAAATAVNGEGAGHVARAAAARGAWLVHVSTDYVFDGRKGEPYVESDPVGPISAYGRSKLAGERAIAGAAPDGHTIIRSSWLFGAGGRSFPKTILRLAGERPQLTVVDDQVGCPTFTGHLADAIVRLAERPIPGILHVAGGGECSWFQFARAVLERAGIDCEILPGTTAQLARPAPRPTYSVLRTERDAPQLPGWQAGLEEFLAASVPSP